MTERGGRERETERVSNSGYICGRRERQTETDRDRDRQRQRHRERRRTNERTNEFFINEGKGISTIRRER